MNGADKNLAQAPIDLDFNATTPISDEVAQCMRPFLDGGHGNPSSATDDGRAARAAIDAARSDVAALIGAASDEVVFNSGGSEGDNHAVKGCVFAAMRNGRSASSIHVVASAIEHPAVENALRFLEDVLGVRVTRVAPHHDGVIKPSSVRDALSDDTVLVSVMLAHNETGAMQPLRDIVDVVREESRALIHTDAAQAVGKVVVDVSALGVDMLTLVGHKMYGPKGVGALYLRRGVEIEPHQHGGGQECGRRAGTENTLLVVGLGAAARFSQRAIERASSTSQVRDRFEHELSEFFGDDVMFHSAAAPRLPNTSFFTIRDIDGQTLLNDAVTLRASTGSACHTGKTGASAVLTSMGVDAAFREGPIRVSLGRATTGDDVSRAARLLRDTASRMRSLKVDSQSTAS